MGDTLLLVCPPDDPLGLLADSVGGGKVPAWFKGPSFDTTPPLEWVWRQGYSIVPGHPRALLLQLDGAPDEIGMGRALAVVSRLRLEPIGLLGIGTESPHTIASYLVSASPTYRLATLAADGREKES